MLPLFLEEKLRSYYPDRAEDIINGYSARRKTSFRINRLKTTREDVVSFLDAGNVKYSQVAWYPDAFMIEEEPSIGY